VSLLTRRSSSCRYIYSTNTPQRKEPWLTERRESTLTASHICHRPCIPFRHVLIERRCTPKHCKRGCNKEKKDHNPPQTTKKVPFQNKKVTKRVRIVIRWNSSVVYSNTQQRKGVATEREREYTYCFPYLSPPPYSIWTRPDKTQLRKKTLQEEGATKKRKTNPPQTTKKVPFQKHKIKNNKTCENCDPMKLELSYIQNTQRLKAWPQRGRESTLTVLHLCHRPRIPVGHVWIERRCPSKHCKRRERRMQQKEKKDQTHHTNTTKGPVS
jgi:hypothetical protein